MSNKNQPLARRRPTLIGQSWATCPPLASRVERTTVNPHLWEERRKLFPWKASVLFPEAGEVGVVKAEPHVGRGFLYLKKVRRKLCGAHSSRENSTCEIKESCVIDEVRRRMSEKRWPALCILVPSVGL